MTNKLLNYSMCNISYFNIHAAVYGMLSMATNDLSNGSALHQFSDSVVG